MARTARTDLAAPSVIDPAAFSFVAGVYFGSNASEDFDALLGEWMSEKDDKAGWYSKKPKVLADFPPLDPVGNFARKGTCDHCGARFDWGAVYVHTSGKHIVVGNVCADTTLSVPTRHDLETNRLKSRLAAQRLAARKAAAARAEAAAQGFEWLYDTGRHNNKTLDDIAHKGLTYGGLTARQIELIKRIHDGTPTEWQVRKLEAQAKREAEEAAAQPVPQVDGRIDFEGTVLTTKEQEGYMPGSTCIKILVQHATGYKLWGTMPSALDAKRGDVVAFSARVERSDKDDKFGFFSRPTKPRLIKAAETT